MNKSPIAVCVTTLLIPSTGPAFAMDWDSGPYFGASVTRNDADFGITTGNGDLDFDD